MKKFVLTLFIILSLVLVIGSSALADEPPNSDSTSVGLEVEVIEPEPSLAPSFGGGGGGGTPIYSIETNLFSVEKTYYIDYTGGIQKEIKGTSQDGNLTITILDGTTALDRDGKRLKTLEVLVNEDPPAPPENTSIIGLAYDFEPTGATFNPPIAFTWVYDPVTFPGDVADLVLAYYSEELSRWIELPCIVDSVTHTITASVSHFTTFAIIGEVALILPEPEEPEEPPTTVIEEPEEPEVIEPEVIEPEVEEPEEPEVIEPEVVEPEAEELVVEEWEMSWLLTISLSSSLSVIAGIICWFWLRRRRRRSREREGVSS